MKKIFLTLSLMLAGCSQNNGGNPVTPLVPLSLDYNAVSIQVGESWLYKRHVIQVPVFEQDIFSDTNPGYSYFHATKDTIINSKKFVIIEGKDYEVNRDTVLIHEKRCAIHCGDSIELYEFSKSDYTWLSGVMKRQSGSIPPPDNASRLEKIALENIFYSANYDSSTYYAYLYPMIFPLKRDSIYTYRDTDISGTSDPYQQRFVGLDTISIPMGRFIAYKWQILTGKTSTSNPTIFYTWIGAQGLLRRYIDFGEVCVSDNSGVTARKVHLYTISELVGKFDIDVANLTPRGK